MSNGKSSPNGDEIDLIDLMRVIWRGKWLILCITLIFSIGGVFYAIGLPNTYRADVLLSPAQTESRPGGIGGQLGGLAALAGISTGNAINNITLAEQLIFSREFVREFIEKRDILVDLMAVQEWDEKNQKLVINPGVFDINNQIWVRESYLGAKPTEQEAYKAFTDRLSFSRNRDNPFITVTMLHASPVIAKQWLDWLVEDINEVIRQRDYEEAERSIQYLQAEIQKTNLAEVQRVLYNLIEEQIKAKMLTQIRGEYVFKVLDPAVVPEQRYSPKRAVICIVITFLGGVFGVLSVLLLSAFRK